LRTRRAFAPRWAGAAGVALALGTGVFPAVIASRAPAASSAPARSAHTTSVDDTGHLRLLNASGAILNEQGPVSGTLPGRVKVRLVVRASVTASFTIEARGGSILGHGSAVLHSSREYSSFGGSLSVDRGTGRYAHASGAGQLYGVIDRGNDALTVQTVGRLRY
jgi:hypothetical protein